MRKVKFVKIYDEAYDLANITVEDDFEYGQTIVIGDGFFVDFDVSGNPVAIEMVEASKNFSMLRQAFSPAKIKGVIQITEEVIRIEMRIPEKSRFLEKEVPNDYGLSAAEFDFTISGNIL